MFEFATATRIMFGRGSVTQALPAIKQFGARALVVQGFAEQYAQPILDSFKAEGISLTVYRVRGEPTIQSVQQAIEAARQHQAEMVIALGGGSAIDTAKAVAAMLANPGELLDYLEVVGKGQTLRNPSLPCITIPTTSGTGSEVTRNAVLEVPEKSVKVSLRSTYMLPSLAVVDPELTLSLPPRSTASSGLDALTQVIEPFVSSKANPLVSALCREGTQRTGRSLRRAVFDGGDYPAREDMSLTSLIGGLAWIDAKQRRTSAGTLDGKTAAAVPSLEARLVGEWDLPRVAPGLTLTGAVLHSGSAWYDNANTAKVPGWTRVDVGARYAFKMASTPLTARFAIENVGNRDYWVAGYSGGLAVAAPRTVLVSVTAQF